MNSWKVFSVTLLLLARLAFPGSNDFLVPFWGSDLSPMDSASYRVCLQLD